MRHKIALIMGLAVPAASFAATPAQNADIIQTIIVTAQKRSEEHTSELQSPI